MPERKDYEQTTYEKDIVFLTNLENAKTEARQLISTLQRGWFNYDRRTRHEMLALIDTKVAVDLYSRIQALAEYRGQRDNFEYDIALLVHNAGKIDPRAKGYYAKVRDLYLRMLARYQFWMDELGILLSTQFTRDFSDQLIQAMQEEYVRGRRARRQREVANG